MTYSDLASRLIATGTKLQQNPEAISGDAAAKIAKSLNDLLSKFEGLLASSILENAPEVIRLRTLLSFSQMDLKALQALAIKLGFKLPGGAKATALKIHDKFLALAIANQSIPQAITRLEMISRIKERPAPDITSDEKLRAELRRLGSLTSEEAELELLSHYNDETGRALARAAGLKPSKSAKLKTLLPKLIHHAQRHYENTCL